MGNAEILVAGAGPVGLLVAHSLTRAGVSVDIVDTGMWACAHSYALALHPRTVDLLAKAGIAEGLVGNASAVRTLALYDEKERRAEIRLDQATGQPMLVLPQSALEEQLEKSLDSAGVHVQWRQKLMRVKQSDRHVSAELNRYAKESSGYVIAGTEWTVDKSWTADYAFVVGADGYNSSVRRSLGVSFPQVAPCAWYAVFEFRSNTAMHEEVQVSFGERTTDVLWPLGNGLFRWSFQLPDYVDSEVDRLAAYRERVGEPAARTKDRVHFTSGDIDQLADSHLSEFIAARAPWFKGSIDQVGWRTMVRFERRLASTFGSGRCWLAGDAAHLGGPVGVQSLNVGLSEAQDLSAAILRGVRTGGHTEPLEAYNHQYMAEWKRLLGVDDGLEARPEVSPWIWQNRDRLVSCLPAHGEDLVGLLNQVGLQFRAPQVAGAVTGD